MNQQLARLVKNDISLVEYGDALQAIDDRYFIQSGIVGFFANKKQLQDLYDILNYYLNIENFEQCQIVIDDKKIDVVPKG
jgi:hypothetical protein